MPRCLLIGLLLGMVSSAQAATTGVLTGIVKFPGETPPAAMIANRDDAACPRGIAQNHLLVRQESLGLQNVLVVVEIEERTEPYAKPVSLTFDHCTLIPRVQSVPAGASLTLLDRDEVAHDLIVTLNGDSVFETSLEPHRPVRRPLIHEGLHKVNCGSHLWERAWIYVSKNPYAAVTDSQGRFTIANIPEGRYTVRAWHEGWIDKGHDPDGRIERQPMQQDISVSITAGKTKDITFDNLKPTF